jgi:hypothetical protein
MAKKSSKNRNYRHGDVYLFPVKGLSKKLKEVDTGVVAYGEVTGHRHQVLNGTVLTDENGNLFLRATEETELHHLDEAQRTADHKPLHISEGDYRVVIQEEYTPAGWQRVVD